MYVVLFFLSTICKATSALIKPCGWTNVAFKSGFLRSFASTVRTGSKRAWRKFKTEVVTAGNCSRRLFITGFESSWLYLTTLIKTMTDLFRASSSKRDEIVGVGVDGVEEPWGERACRVNQRFVVVVDSEECGRGVGGAVCQLYGEYAEFVLALL